MIIQVEKKNYPNGDPFMELRIEGVVIGRAAIVDEGYIVHGRRKAVPLLSDAANQMLESHAVQSRVVYERWHDWLRRLREEDLVVQRVNG